MDDFSWAHLAAFIERSVWEEDREAFAAWARDVLEDDPLLADYGWVGLYESFQDEVA